jgi:hypothetical protein
LRTTALSILVSLSVIVLSAQTVHRPVGAAYTRAGTYTLKGADVFSYAANQAALANCTSPTVGIYGERRFLLHDLSFYHLVTAIPTSSGNFGFNASYSGSTPYNDAQVGLAYGRKLGALLSVGAQFNYYSMQVAGYGRSSAVNFEAGFLLHVSEQLHAGFHVYNPTGSSLNKGEEEKLASVYNMGVGYEASEKFFTGVEIQKTEGADINVLGSLQYKFDRKLFARAGFASVSSTYHLGAGVLLNQLRLDVTASVHPQLGITPGLLLIYNRPEK